MLYKITKSYGRGAEQELPKKFATIHEAKNFIAETIQTDQAMKVAVIYRIYEGADFIEEFDSTKVQASSPIQDEHSHGGGKSSSATFKPTPFNTAPRPTGMPKNWYKDDDKEDK